MDIAKVLATKEEELAKVKAQMKQVEDDVARLRKTNDTLLTRGIELQGSIRTLNELLAVTPEVVETHNA